MSQPGDFASFLDECRELGKKPSIPNSCFRAPGVRTIRGLPRRPAEPESQGLLCTEFIECPRRSSHLQAPS
eukprot:4829304-Pyramimonas_sp.AAC.1